MDERTANRPRGRRGPAPGTSRGPRLPRAEREAQLIQVAEEIFSVHGYHGTTMQAVAEAASVTKPVIYDLFGSKDGLLAACLARTRAELFALLREAWRGLTVSDLEAGFRIGILTFYRFIDTHAALWHLIAVEGPSSPGAYETMQETRLLHAREIAATFNSMPSLSKIPPVFVEGLSEGIIGACERVAAWRSTRPDVTAEFATELVMMMTWHGMSQFVEQFTASP